MLSEGKGFYRMNVVKFHNESKLCSLEGWISFILGALYKIRGGDIEVKKCADY
jgi:hypothetical protein